MNIIQKIAEDLSLKKMQVEAAVQLLDEGNTVPFIARYRKEATQSRRALAISSESGGAKRKYLKQHCRAGETHGGIKGSD